MFWLPSLRMIKDIIIRTRDWMGGAGAGYNSKDRSELAMFETTVIGSEIQPISLEFPGVTVRVLHRGDSKSGQMILTQMAPGSVIPEHWHSIANENIYIINGDFIEAGVTH